MALSSVYDLLELRWRAGQLFLALVDGDLRLAAAIEAASRVEGITRADLVDEFALLRAQFGHRTRYWLAGEVDRMASKLGVRRCD